MHRTWIGRIGTSAGVLLWASMAAAQGAPPPGGAPGSGKMPPPGGTPKVVEVAEPLTAVQLPPENVADDGWYAVMVGEDQIGYARHTIKFTTEKGQRVYKYTEEFEVRAQPNVLFTGEHIEATLNDAFGLQAMIFTRTTPTEDFNLNISTRAGKFIVNAPGKGEVEEKIPTSWAVFLRPMIGQWLKDRKLLEVGKTATVRVFQTAGQPGKFYKEYRIEVISTGKMPLKFSRPEKSEMPEVGGPPKAGGKEVETITCSMTPADGGETLEFSVDKDGKLMRFKEGAVEEWRAADEFTARGSTEWILQPKGRRDPFKEVTTPLVASVGPTTGESKELPITGEEADRILQECKARLDRMKIAAQATPQTDEHRKELETLYLQILSDQHRLVAGRAPEDIRRQVDALVEESKKFYKPIDALLKELDLLVQKAKETFEAGVEENDVRYFQELAGFVATGREMQKRREVGDDPTGPVRVADRVSKIEAYKKRADIRIEFGTKDLKKKQTGIIYVLQDREIPVSIGVQFLGRPIQVNTKVTVSSSASMAIINGTKEASTLLEGEGVPEIDNLVVRRIERDGIIYLYRDEEIKVSFR